MKVWIHTVGALLVSSGRILRDHWPQLLGLYLVGATARHGFLWLAVWASNHSATLGLLILPLAPLATLVSLVLMLRAIRETLPAFRDEPREASRRVRIRRDLAVATSVMLPFLTVYSAQGLLQEDSRTYVSDVSLDDYIRFGSFATDRLDYASGWTLLAMIGGALLVRQVIFATRAEERFLVVAGVAAYIEVLWMVTLGRALVSELKGLGTWLAQRDLVDVWLRIWDGVVAWSGSVGEFLVAAFGWGMELAIGFSLLLLLPIGWLAMGVSIHRGSSNDLYSSQHEIQRMIGERMQARMRLSGWFGKLFTLLAVPVVEPVSKAWAAIRWSLRAGARPSVVFCLAFIVLNLLQLVVAQVVHALVGARETLLATSLSAHQELVIRSVHFVVSMPVLAAAVNLLLLTERGTGPRRALSQGQDR